MHRSAQTCRLILVLLFIGLAGWLPASAAPATPPEYATDHILVKSKRERPPAALPTTAERIFGNWFLVPLPPGQSVAAAMANLHGRPGVAGVYVDQLLQLPDEPAATAAPLPFGAPNDPLFGRQWHMPQIGVPAVWEITAGAYSDTGEGVVVAVVDTGVAVGGPDGFCNPLHSEYNVGTNSSAPGAAYDGHGHGTHVAGTVAGCAGNGIGVVGVAPAAQVMAVKALSDSGGTTSSYLAEGIVWAADHGAQVMNMSLGSPCNSTWPSCSSPIVNDAIDHAASMDVVVVISAGNDNRTFIGQPGNHPEAIAVGATDFNKDRAYYSNRGSTLGLVAPGGDTRVDLNNDGFPDGVLQETQRPVWDYYYFSGTSMAAPHVTGAATLLRACVPEATRDDVRDALESSAEDLGAAGYDNFYGNGFLQAYDALVLLAGRFGRDPAKGCALDGCLTVATDVTGEGAVAIAPELNCTPDGEPASTGYEHGTVVSLTAMPAEGYWFAGWSGGAMGMSNPLEVELTRDLDVTADFQPCLSVTASAGAFGMVSVATPPNCGANGFSGGTTVSIVATPDDGYFFDQWSGGASGADNPLTITLTGDLAVEATFASCLNVTATAAANGSVAIETPPNCGAAGFSRGTTVTIVATPDDGYFFDQWSGGASGAENPLTVPLSGDLDVTALFAPCLSVTTGTIGSGTVSVQTAPTCAGAAGYSGGTTVTILATPDAGYRFTGWGGDATGVTNPLTIQVTANLVITAAFEARPLEPLAVVSLSANGTAAGLAYADEDAVLDNPQTGLSLLFDGSAYGLGSSDIDALDRLADGTLLISLDAPARNLPGIGSVVVDDSDIVRFNPATGRFGWYFDGSDVGLTTTAEDVDAVALLPDGRLLISTAGTVAVTGVSAADEDVLVFTGALGSVTTTGSWALYLDGSDLGAGLGDIDGLAVDGNGIIYISAEASVTLGGTTMAPGDIFTCAPLSLGAATQCAIARFWQGTANGFAVNANVDALDVFLP